MIVTAKKTSLEDFLTLPETKPASEYIEGNIYQKPMPQGKHSLIQTELVSAIRQIGKPPKIAYAFTELRCTFANRSLVPDISVFAWENIPLDEDGEVVNRFEIPPDWIIEILSPEQSANQVINKIIFCLKHGTKLGWLIEPNDKSVIIFEPDKLPEVKYNDEQLTVLNIFQDWQLSVNDLFSWLKLN